MYHEALGDPRLVADQPAQLHAKGVRKRIGEGREQDACIMMISCEMDRAVQRHNCLTRTRGSSDPRRAIKRALDRITLLGMKEDRPLLPRVFECPLEFFSVFDGTEAPLRIRMIEGILGYLLDRRVWSASCRELQQRLCRLMRKMVGEVQKGIFGGLLDFVHPVGWHAVLKE